MYLYNLTLSRASGIQCAIYGNFSAPKAQEIVVSRGSIIELLQPDDNGRMQTICSTEVFGMIRSLMPFRLNGAGKDCIIVGSDSGRIVILDFQKDRKQFKKLHQETFGKSGCRRIVPGQMIAADPQGRACMIAAIEKQKFVYVLNRDSAANLTISSPLEAHKSHTIVFSVCALDVGFDNPVFAAIELDYQDADQDPSGEAAKESQKHLTLYELDLGLNHVVRKWSNPVDNGANLLIPVPGGGSGPGGVLICAENFIIYKNEDHDEVRAVIPRRSTLGPHRGVLIVSYATHKQKSLIYFFVQSEYGDIYRVSLSFKDTQVNEVVVKYFDTIPPCVSICVLKTGFLFAASEFGNHTFYQFQGIGDDDSVESSSANLTETEDGFQPVYFDPRELRNLALLDEMDNLCPLMDMKVANLLNEEIPQIYSVCGRGPRSSLRVMRPGLAVTEMAKSPLPGNPTAVWTTKRTNTSDFDNYIIVSFVNATLVLSIGETIQEVSDSGFLGAVSTLQIQLLVDDSLLQVHPNGLRHIRSDRRINEWRAPGRKQVIRATTNERQVVIAMTGGEIIYFELASAGTLMETEKKEVGGDITSLDIAPVPAGRQRSRYLAVGTADSTVRVLSLEPEDCLKVLAVQQVTAIPDSLLLLHSTAMGTDAADDASGILFLHIGLANGILLRTEVDRVTGKLTDTRTRFLGTRPPKLFALSVRGQRSMIALSSRPWLGYSDMGRYKITPLSYKALDHCSGFSSEQCPEGFCAVSAGSLRILSLERLGEALNQKVMRLRYTPRHFAIDAERKTLALIESDHATMSIEQRKELGDSQAAAAAQGIEFDEEAAAKEEQLGAPKAESGRWASCVRIVDPVELQTTSVLDLDNNEAAISLALVKFNNWPGEGTMLAVGTTQGMSFMPRQIQEGFIRIYRLKDGKTLELVHKTPVGGIPGALCAYRGRLLAGVGKALRIYDMGKKRLLRKSEYRSLPTHITSLHVLGERIFVGDQQESFHFFKYKKSENVLYEFADDVAPRHLVSALPLDYDSVAGGDKFGNFFICRVPAEISAQIEDDPTGGKFAGASGLLNGAPNKVEDIINFHVGDMVTALQRSAMQPGGQEVLIYATLMGGVGAMLPFLSREDWDFFSHLEMHMRQELPPLAGRDHLAYRGYYFPVKDVIDGDLCEQYPMLPSDKQASIAEELDRSPGEVLKKLEDIRNKIL